MNKRAWLDESIAAINALVRAARDRSRLSVARVALPSSPERPSRTFAELELDLEEARVEVGVEVGVDGEAVGRSVVGSAAGERSTIAPRQGRRPRSTDGPRSSSERSSSPARCWRAQTLFATVLVATARPRTRPPSQGTRVRGDRTLVPADTVGRTRLRCRSRTLSWSSLGRCAAANIISSDSRCRGFVMMMLSLIKIK